MNHVFEVVGQEHEVLSEVRSVILLEQRQQPRDEVRPIKNHVFLGDKTVNVSVIVE